MTPHFTKELTDLLNKHNVDNTLQTPDFILADYVVANLKSMKRMQQDRDKWLGVKVVTKIRRPKSLDDLTKTLKKEEEVVIDPNVLKAASKMPVY